MTADVNRPAAAPRWLWITVLVGASALTWIGAIGVTLAMAGVYRTWIVLPLAAVAVGVSWPIVSRVAGPDRATSAAHRWAVGAVLIASLLASWSAAGPGHHVITTHDPGVYANTAVWLAETGDLRMPVGGDDEPLVRDVLADFEAPWVLSPGAYLGDGELEFQFSHAPSAVMAAAYDVAGQRGLFALPALVGLIGLLATYLLATRFVRSHGLALAATAALGISIPFLYVTRSTYSEPFTLAVVATGLAVLSRRTLTVDRAGVAGALIGSALLFRIDGQLTLVALFGAGVLLALAGASTRALLAGLGAAAVPAVLGVVDLVFFSGGYWADHQDFAWALRVVALVAIGVTLLVIRHRDAVWVHRLRDTWLPAAATPAASVTAALLAFGWLVRPQLQDARADWPPDGAYADRVEALQTAAGLDPDGTRSYAEYTIASLGWNFGPFMVALAIVGLALLVRRALQDITKPAAVLMAFFVVSATAYLIDWRITPYQPWAMRRFVPVVLPIMLIAASVGVEAIARRAASSWRADARPVIVGIATAAIVVPTAWTTWPVRDLAEQRSYIGSLEQVCDAVDGDTVLAIGTPIYNVPIRVWCGAPAVSSFVGRPDIYEQYAERARRTCTPAALLLTDLAFLPSGLRTWNGYTDPVTIVFDNDVFPEESILDAPAEYAQQRLEIAVIRVVLPDDCAT